MSRRTAATLARCLGTLAVALLACLVATPVHAQEPAPPTLDRAEVTIVMAHGDADTITSTFRLAAPVGADTTISHLLFDRAGVEVTDISAGAGAESLAHMPAEERLTVFLPAGTHEYVIEHSVQRDSTARAVPLVVPEIDTARQANVEITMTLPDGQRLVGDSMPTFHEIRTDGGAVTVRHAGGALPSVVVSGYGTQGRITTGTVLSVLGIGFLVVVVAVWVRRSAGRQEPRA